MTVLHSMMGNPHWILQQSDTDHDAGALLAQLAPASSSLCMYRRTRQVFVLHGLLLLLLRLLLLLLLQNPECQHQCQPSFCEHPLHSWTNHSKQYAAPASNNAKGRFPPALGQLRI